MTGYLYTSQLNFDIMLRGSDLFDEQYGGCRAHHALSTAWLKSCSPRLIARAMLRPGLSGLLATPGRNCLAIRPFSAAERAPARLPSGRACTRRQPYGPQRPVLSAAPLARSQFPVQRHGRSP